jgi:predicted nucleic acid-binding protein
MKALFDSSVVVSALVVSHKFHAASIDWLNHVHRGQISGAISAHTLAEVYGYLTGHGKQRPDDVKKVLEREILPYFEIVALTELEYKHLLTYLVDVGITGAAIYDAIHVCAAKKAEADILIHINHKDFIRVCPAPPPRIVTVTELDETDGQALK